MAFRTPGGNIGASPPNGRHDAQLLGNLFKRSALREPGKSVDHCLLIRHWRILPHRDSEGKGPAPGSGPTGPIRPHRSYMSNRPLLICAFCLLLLPLLSRAEAPARTPVIVDTDIGDDTDDSWALVYALKSPGLDLKLVTTTFGKRQYRGALIAKFLTAAGRTDIPVGLGAPGDGDGKTRMQNWLGDFTVASYRGHIFDDGVQALVDTVNASPIPVTIIAIGPLNTIGAALQRDPGIAARANLVAMLGSIRVGYSNHPGQITEYNIWRDIPDAKRVLAAPWRSIAFTPLDTGNSPTIVGTRYATHALLDQRQGSGRPLAAARSVITTDQPEDRRQPFLRQLVH